MINEIISKLKTAKTPAEILAYKSDILNIYNDLGENLKNKVEPFIYDTHRDICSLALHKLHSISMEYNFPVIIGDFYKENAIPFLKKHKPGTLNIIELSILFYSIQICELLECDFLKDDMEKLFSRNKENIFLDLWGLFRDIITEQSTETFKTYEYKSQGYFTIKYDNVEKIKIYYLKEEKYEKLINMIFENLKNSKYFEFIQGNWIGCDFTKMRFITYCQAPYIEVSYNYLCEMYCDYE